MEHRVKAKAVLEAAEKIAESKIIAEAEKPSNKPKVKSNNPGNGYHGVLYRVHFGDNSKVDREYRKMHARVKDMAGEAGHLKDSKKPNLMVRDYLDSKRGRHLESYEKDDKYIKKDFGSFAKTYDPKLFAEGLELPKLTATEVFEAKLAEKLKL